MGVLSQAEGDEKFCFSAIKDSVLSSQELLHSLQNVLGQTCMCKWIHVWKSLFATRIHSWFPEVFTKFHFCENLFASSTLLAMFWLKEQTSFSEPRTDWSLQKQMSSNFDLTENEFLISSFLATHRGFHSNSFCESVKETLSFHGILRNTGICHHITLVRYLPNDGRVVRNCCVERGCGNGRCVTNSDFTWIPLSQHWSADFFAHQ